MARFLVRSFFSTIITMLLVSMTLFVLLEVGTGDVALKILGVFSTEEQRASYRAQLGLDQPGWLRYLDWLVGNDWRAQELVGYPLVAVPNPQTGAQGWWANVDGRLTRWRMDDGQLMALERQADGSTTSRPVSSEVWAEDPATGAEFFWGVDTNNRAARWVQGEGATLFVRTKTGMTEIAGGAAQFIPLRKGLIRGDAGMSLQTGRPVSATLWTRVRNTAILAGVAFLFVMPLALLFGILAGINEGKPLDRAISITGLALTATPEFVTGIFLILIFGIWLRWLPAISVFLSDDALFRDPKLIVLPVLTLTAVELGYVARMTRASMVEVMGTAYIRTAILKGMPRWRVVWRHAVRNALMAPITIIMLHVNWLISGVVVVEAIFGYPGLGKYIYDAAIFGDINAVEAAAMLTVVIAVTTRLIGDLAYTLLNPRIRYA